MPVLALINFGLQFSSVGLYSPDDATDHEYFRPTSTKPIGVNITIIIIIIVMALDM